MWVQCKHDAKYAVTWEWHGNFEVLLCPKHARRGADSDIVKKYEGPVAQCQTYAYMRGKKNMAPPQTLPEFAPA